MGFSEKVKIIILVAKLYAIFSSFLVKIIILVAKLYAIFSSLDFDENLYTYGLKDALYDGNVRILKLRVVQKL